MKADVLVTMGTRTKMVHMAQDGIRVIIAAADWKWRSIDSRALSISRLGRPIT